MDPISIHAPAKGATSGKGGKYLYNLISIHAPAKGATVHSFSGVKTLTISIHAPAKGATVSSKLAFVLVLNFNPRSREGSDSVSHL